LVFTTFFFRFPLHGPGTEATRCYYSRSPFSQWPFVWGRTFGLFIFFVDDAKGVLLASWSTLFSSSALARPPRPGARLLCRFSPLCWWVAVGGSFSPSPPNESIPPWGRPSWFFLDEYARRQHRSFPPPPPFFRWDRISQKDVPTPTSRFNFPTKTDLFYLLFPPLLSVPSPSSDKPGPPPSHPRWAFPRTPGVTIRRDSFLPSRTVLVPGLLLAIRSDPLDLVEPPQPVFAWWPVRGAGPVGTFCPPSPFLRGPCFLLLVDKKNLPLGCPVSDLPGRSPPSGTPFLLPQCSHSILSSFPPSFPFEKPFLRDLLPKGFFLVPRRHNHF